VDHVFYFTLFEDKTKEVGRFKVESDKYLYILYPPTEELKAKVPQKLFDEVDIEKQFSEQYLNTTGNYCMSIILHIEVQYVTDCFLLTFRYALETLFR
jgi:hypothetical protein